MIDTYHQNAYKIKNSLKMHIRRINHSEYMVASQIPASHEARQFLPKLQAAPDTKQTKCWPPKQMPPLVAAPGVSEAQYFHEPVRRVKPRTKVVRRGPAIHRLGATKKPRISRKESHQKDFLRKQEELLQQFEWERLRNLNKCDSSSTARQSINQRNSSQLKQSQWTSIGDQLHQRTSNEAECVMNNNTTLIAEPKDTLEGLIQILEEKEVKSCDKKIGRSAIVPEPIKPHLIDSSDKQVDEVEKKLMKMFEFGERIKILSIETLPDIDALEAMSENETKPNGSPEISYTSGIIYDAVESEILSDEVKTRVDLYEEKNKSKLTRASIADNEKVLIEEANHLEHFNVTNSVAEVNLEFGNKRSEETLRRAFSFDTSEVKVRNFKRSLSLVRKPALNGPTARVSLPKLDSSSQIDKLLEMEKSALLIPHASHSHTNFTSTIPVKASPEVNYKNMTRQESLIDFTQCSVALASLKKVSAAQLIPWIVDEKVLRSNFKYEVCYSKMLQLKSLVALFKCMGSQCSFATNNIELFFNHLSKHENATTKLKENFYRQCSYCLFKSSKGLKELPHHVNDYHIHDLYQCGHCFFRSCEKETCFQHILKIHSRLSTTIYKCNGREMNHQKMFERLKRKRAQFVEPIVCKLCNLKYFLLDDILNHLEHHMLEGNEQEKKSVRERMAVLNTLFDSHAYGMVQCLFCLHGSATESELSDHMVEHPSEPRYVCVRQSVGDAYVDPFSVESALITKLESRQEIHLTSYSKLEPKWTSDNLSKVVDRDLAVLISRTLKANTLSLS